MTLPFHLAFSVKDKEETRKFYASVLGCKIGREAETWIDFNFFGHQLSAHVQKSAQGTPQVNQVEHDIVPIPHFGVILLWEDWQSLIEKLRDAGVEFFLAPKIRFKGEAGEQGTFFITDPSGNSLEFKSFKNKDLIFADF